MKLCGSILKTILEKIVFNFRKTKNLILPMCGKFPRTPTKNNGLLDGTETAIK